MNQSKIIIFAYLAFAIISFFLGVGYFIYGLEFLKPSGGGSGGFIGLILILSIVIVNLFTPMFGSYASLIVYGVIGIVLLRLFIKKRSALVNGT